MLRHLLAILIPLLTSPTLDQTPGQSDSKPKTDQNFRKMGLDPVPFNVEAIGLKIHLPELATVSLKPSGDRPVFQVNDASEPQMWRMRIESIQYSSAQNHTTPDTAAYLDQVLARQGEHSLLVTKTTGYGGVEGKLCFIQRAQAYFELGSYELAIEDETRAIEIDPTNARAYNNRGVSYRELGDFEQSIKNFTKAIELNPQHPNPYYNRAKDYGALGDRDQMRRDMLTAAQMGNQEAQEWLLARGQMW